MQKRASFKLIFTIFAILATVSTEARAALQVFPTRVLLTDKQKTGSVTLKHEGDSPARYKISAVFYRVEADGKMVKVEDPGLAERSLVSSVRFSPRAVTLQPGLQQVVRVLVRAPELAPGDYRAHIYFETADDDIDVSKDSAAAASGAKLDLTLKARVAIAVPIVFRHGSAQPATVKLSELKLTQEKPGASFSVRVARGGDSFAYGTLKAWFGGEPVGHFKGISIYNAEQTFKFKLSATSPLKGGKLKLAFFDGEDESQERLLDSIEVPVP